MPLSPIHRQRMVPADPIHLQRQSDLFRLPNELLLDIFGRLPAVDLARVEQVCRAGWHLAQPAWPKACGPKPWHRALHAVADYKQLALEQWHIRCGQAQRTTQSLNAPAYADPDIILSLVTNTYLQDDARKCETFAQEALCALQQHTSRNTSQWHLACASLLMMQQRFDEAQPHIDALQLQHGEIPHILMLVAARYGGPFAVSPSAWHNFDDSFRHQAFLAAIAGHQPHSVDALMDLDVASPDTRRRYSQAAAIAARHNNVNAFQILIANGALVDRVPNWLEGAPTMVCAAMWEAAYHGHTEIVSYLAAWNIAGDSISDGRGRSSPLDAAIAQSHLDVVNVLMRTLSKPEQWFTGNKLRLASLVSPDRSSAVRRTEMLAALVTSWHIPINLIDHQGRSFLHLAAEYGDAELVACALELGANPTKLDHTGQSPLEHALNVGAESVVAILKQHPANRTTPLVHYKCKSKLARDIIYPVLAAQEPMLQHFAGHWRQFMAPAQITPRGVFHPHMSWFVEDMQRLYTRTFSTQTLGDWHAGYLEHPTINLARQLGDTMRFIQLGFYLSPTDFELPLGQQIQIAAIWTTWFIARGSAHRLTTEHKNAFIQQVAQGVSHADRTELLSFAQTPFGARLAAGMRAKYEAETRLWNAFGLFPAHHDR